MKVFKSFVLLLIVLAFCMLAFSGCNDKDKEEEEEVDPKAITKLTITGIPAKIPVYKNETVLADTYKVYVYASDYQTHDNAPQSKGMAKLAEERQYYDKDGNEAYLQEKGVLQEDGTWTITVDMRQPTPFETPGGEDPNVDWGDWVGTALYFSVIIAPYDSTEYQDFAIYMKGGTTLNKNKETVDWNNLMDFRDEFLVNSAMNTEKQTHDFYFDVIIEDQEWDSVTNSSKYDPPGDLKVNSGNKRYL